MNNTANAAPHFIQRRVLHIVFASTSGHNTLIADLCGCQLSEVPRIRSLLPRVWPSQGALIGVNSFACKWPAEWGSHDSQRNCIRQRPLAVDPARG